MRDLARIVGAAHVIAPAPAWALRDATEWQGLVGRADALVLPGTVEEVAGVVRWAIDKSVGLTVRGGGTGLAGGAVPDGGVVLAMDRLSAVRRFEPGRRRIEVEAGVTTATVRRRAREEGLLLGPDPGAAESSQIGGNVATNAGGPHSARYGPMRRWVTAVEAVLGSGEIVRAGAGLPRESTGVDLAAVLCGSEGTLAVITAVTLRLEPAPERPHAVVADHPDASAGAEAVLRVLGAGVPVSALDFVAVDPGFQLLAEVEDPAAAGDLHEALGGRLEVRDARELWRWRDTVSHRVAARRGGKLSEDVVVPVDALAALVDGTVAIGERHGLVGCSWGHAADGIAHSTFLVDRSSEELRRAAAAAEELFDLALSLGGAVSGEHGVGRLKRHRVVPSPAHLAVEAAFDPHGVLGRGAAHG